MKLINVLESYSEVFNLIKKKCEFFALIHEVSALNTYFINILEKYPEVIELIWKEMVWKNFRNWLTKLLVEQIKNTESIKINFKYH